MAHPQSRLVQLPPEISTAIPRYLSNRDIKNLRLTCKALCAISQLRLHRVFLSANPRNIEAFRAIADHQVLREQVVEIIWDDARLQDGPIPIKSCDPESPNFDPEYDEDFDRVFIDEYSDEDSSEDEGCPHWFAKACRLNLEGMRAYKGLDVDRPDHIARAERAANVSLWRSWKYYRRLLRQQSEVLETDADYKAFNYGLLRFPALRRVTITPAAHGWLFRPLYETPMIRAFPPSFNYLIPRTWPLEKRVQRPWESTSESEKDWWRAFRLVTRSLAVAAKVRQAEQREKQQQKPGVTEIIVDVNQLLAGLNAHIFDEECTEQRDLVTALRRANFRRLDLALGVGGLENYGWRAFRSGCLRRTLAAAPDIEHFSLKTDMPEAPDGDFFGHTAVDLHFIPLRDVFPIDTWARLRHFALARFAVLQNDLVSFLGALPATVRSVELSFLFFLEGNHRDFLAGVRDQIGWHERPADQRPALSIGLADELDRPGRGIWADVPVEQFLYHHGPNPFGGDGWGLNQIPHGCGGIVKDAFDPAFERPWVGTDELERLGYVKSLHQAMRAAEE